MLLQVFSPPLVQGRDGTFASFYPLGKGLVSRDSDAAASRWRRCCERIPGWRKRERCAFYLQCAGPCFTRDKTNAAFTCTAVPYIIVSCSLNERVGFL